MKVAEVRYPTLPAGRATRDAQFVHTPPPSRRAALAVSEALINIQNLRLRTFIGFNPEEKVKQQDVVINIEIAYALKPGALDDHVDDALDYKVLTKQVIALVENGRFLLLEKLVGDVLAICTDHPDIKRTTVRIDKPHALRFADSVSLTFHYRASDHHPTTEHGQ